VRPLDQLPFPAGLWSVDAEYSCPDAEVPNKERIWCIVAKELRSGRVVQVWQEELLTLRNAPFPTGKDALFICFSADAELGVFEALGWSAPANVYDCRAEFGVLANRMKIPGIKPVKFALAEAVMRLRVPFRWRFDKAHMQQLAVRGAPFTASEQQALVAYCLEDVEALEALLPELLRRIWKHHRNRERYLQRALFRGEYMKAITACRRTGIALDTPCVARVQDRWDDIKLALIEAVNPEYGVYEGSTFKRNRFIEYLEREGLTKRWPRTASGIPAMDDDTWKAMTALHPQLENLRELTSTLGKLRLTDLNVGSDGRNRCWLNPFGSATGRNQPGSSAYLFGPAKWIRGFAKPEPGMAHVYLDWKSQEIGIGGALARDANLCADYTEGDFYVNFGTRSGRLPEGASKQSHGAERDQLKIACLGVNYGLGERKMAENMGVIRYEVRQIRQAHRLRYRQFWTWIEDVIASAYARGWVRTRGGWQCSVPEAAKVTSVQNWMMQAHGAEMLRIAMVLAHRQGLRIAAPVHDAIYLEAPQRDVVEQAMALRDCMLEASRIVLHGFEVPVEGWELNDDGSPGPGYVVYPNRYMDDRGAALWGKVMGILEAQDRGERRRFVAL